MSGKKSRNALRGNCQEISESISLDKATDELTDDSSPSQGDLVDYVTEATSKCSAQSKEKSQKTCGVCGDVAKSYHFGGLCCDSCKAFFRRTVQSESWETFLCVNGGDCEMSSNRRSCQACRYELCKKIGMDPTLVMNVEDRKALMLRKLERRKQQLLKNKKLKQLLMQEDDQKADEIKDSVATKDDHEPEEVSSCMDWHEADITEPEVGTDMECHQDESSNDCLIIETFSQKNQEKIKGLQKLLRKALIFPEFPKHYYEADVDVTEHLFFVFCKGMGKFFSLVSEFRDLNDKDQVILLKDAVAKSIFIYGAHQFQEENEIWPRQLLSPYCTFPTVSLVATENFIDDDDTFSRMKTFMRKFCRFFDDEVVTLLSLLVAAFDEDIPSLNEPSKISKYKATYTQLLEDYLQHQNASFSVLLFTSELWNCFAAVQELKEGFQKDSSKEKKYQSSEIKDEASFASSLPNFGEYAKMPPKKAFSKRISVHRDSCSPDAILKREKSENEQRNANIPLGIKNEKGHSNDYKDDEVTMVFENIPHHRSVIKQDHNYERSNCTSSRNIQVRSTFQTPDDDLQILLTKRLRGPIPDEEREIQNFSSHSRPVPIRTNSIEIIKIPSNYSDAKKHLKLDERSNTLPRHVTPALLIPVSNHKSYPKSVTSPVIQNLHPHLDGMMIQPQAYHNVHKDLSASQQEECRDCEECRSTFSCVPLPVSERTPPLYRSGESEYNSLADVQSSQSVPLPQYAVQSFPIHYPRNHSIRATQPIRFDQLPYNDQTTSTAAIYLSQQQTPRSAATHPGFQNTSPYPGGSTAGISRETISSPLLTRESPVTKICQNMNDMSTEDDQEIVEAVQNVLPPRLVKHLVSRLGVHHQANSKI